MPVCYEKINYYFLMLYLLYRVCTETHYPSSKVIKFNMKPTYERGLPPNFFIDLYYEDSNGNGVLESNESSNLYLNVSLNISNLDTSNK